MPEPSTAPLTIEEHQDLARELRSTNARLRELGKMVVRIYGREHRTAFAFERATESIGRLCQEVQTQAREDCPGAPVGDWYR